MFLAWTVEVHPRTVSCPLVNWLGTQHVLADAWMNGEKMGWHSGILLGSQMLVPGDVLESRLYHLYLGEEMKASRNLFRRARVEVFGYRRRKTRLRLLPFQCRASSNRIPSLW